jgi:hypothetical protein
VRHARDSEGTPWVAQLRDLYEVHEKGTPQFRLGLWRALFDAPNYRANFKPAIEEMFAYTLEGTLGIVTDRVQSKSYIATLEPDVKATVVEKVREIIERGDGMKWADKDKGIFEYPYKTLVVVASKNTE